MFLHLQFVDPLHSLQFVAMANPKLTIYLDVVSPFAYLAFYLINVGLLSSSLRVVSLNHACFPYYTDFGPLPSLQSNFLFIPVGQKPFLS